MKAQNLKLETIDLYAIKAELLAELPSEAIPTEEEVEEALGEMYQQANRAVASTMYAAEDFRSFESTRFSLRFLGGNLWRKIKEYFCKFMGAGSTASDIFDKMVDYILKLIPGGVFISALITKILRYLINKGYAAVCPIA